MAGAQGDGDRGTSVAGTGNTGGDGETTMPADAVEVGRVLGAWGVKGALRVQPFSADARALYASRRWFLRPPAAPRPLGARPAGGTPNCLPVISARGQGDAVVAIVHGIADRDAAQALAGARVFVPRASFPAPDENEFYWVDLIGLAVRNRDGVDLGTVDGLIETGPHCVLRIVASGADGPVERLVPFVDAYVDRVDMARREITVDWGVDD